MYLFIIGLVFGLVVPPLLDGLTNLLLSFLEMIRSYCAVIITRNNQKIQRLSAEPVHSQIGFVIDVDEEVEDDDI